jgi:hypothetical protein
MVYDGRRPGGTKAEPLCAARPAVWLPCLDSAELPRVHEVATVSYVPNVVTDSEYEDEDLERYAP